MTENVHEEFKEMVQPEPVQTVQYSKFHWIDMLDDGLGVHGCIYIGIKHHCEIQSGKWGIVQW